MSGGKDILQVKDSKGQIKTDNFAKLHSLTSEENKGVMAQAFQKDLLNIAKTIQSKKFFPAIFFAFSKKKVE